MLTIHGRPRRVCSGLTRRELLQIGGAGLFGLSLPRLLAAEQAQPAFQNGRAKSVMFLYLFGGPSQLETFDMKPDVPSALRGPFKPIASRTPDLRLCEHLARTSQVSDKFCTIRTMTHPHNDHNACHYIQTGHDSDGARLDALGRQRFGCQRPGDRLAGDGQRCRILVATRGRRAAADVAGLRLPAK